MDATTQAFLAALVGALVAGGGVLAWHISERQQQAVQPRDEPVVPEGVGSVLAVLRSSAVVVGADDTEVAQSRGGVHDRGQEIAQNGRRLVRRRARGPDGDREALQRRQGKLPQQPAPVGVRVGAHPAVSLRRESLELSPDGKAILYVHDSLQGTDGKLHIYKVNADGTDSKVVIPNTAFEESPRWRPDRTCAFP